MKLPWVTRGRYDALKGSLETADRRLWGVIDKLRNAEATVKRLDDAEDFWRESYKTEFDGHEKTKKEKANAEERWGWWRERAVEVANKLGKETEKAKARTPSHIAGAVVERLIRAGFVSKMCSQPQVLAAVCDALGTGGLDAKTPSDHSTARGPG